MTDYINTESVFRYGMLESCEIVGGQGHRELVVASDPCPRRAPSAMGRRGSSDDPFQNSNSSLVLSIAPDCKSLNKEDFESLLRLSGLPGVIVELMPGLNPMGYPKVAQISWNGDANHLSIRSDRHPGAVSLTGYDPGLSHYASDIWPDVDEPSLLAFINSVEAHGSIGNDYIVTTLVEGCRNRPRTTWPHGHGVCSVSEAFRLAGTKARMYSSAPSYVGNSFTSTMNVFALRDMSAMVSVPNFWRAMGGALAAGSGSPEAQCKYYFMAMRSRLADLLLARDLTYGLSRHVLSTYQSRSSTGSADSTSLRGNELLPHLRYHLVAALNHLYSIGDNLAWVLATLAGAQRNRNNLSLTNLVELKPNAWSKMGNIEALCKGLQNSEALPMVMASRSLRNVMIHRAGLHLGRLRLTPGHFSASQSELMAAWIHPYDLVGEHKVAHWKTISDKADFILEDQSCAFYTFSGLVDRLWESVSTMLNDALASNESCKWTDIPFDWLTASSDELPSGVGPGNAWERQLWGF